MSLSVRLARDFGDLRSNIYGVEGHIREAGSTKGDTIVHVIKQVALMKVFFEGCCFHVRRLGSHGDGHSYEEPRASLMERAAIEDAETATTGSWRQFEEENGEGYAQGMWIEGPPGNWSWFEADLLTSLSWRK